MEERKTKRGRPVVGKPKDTQVIVRMSADEHERLSRVSKRLGLSQSNMIRNCLNSTLNMLEGMVDK